ncbi:DUF551 domain-containing protein [Escherichia coli]
MTTMNREEQKQVLIDTANHIIHRDNTSPYSENLRELARIALAALEVEPIGFRCRRNDNLGDWSYVYHREPDDFERKHLVIEGIYAAPPAPVSVPAAMEIDDDFDSAFEHGKAVGWNAYRASMLQAEPVSNSDELPLDYLQGHKDGLEWAAQLAEANHPQTGDWLYDDQIDLARAIRKGPDMPTVQGGNSPVIPDGWISCSEQMPVIGELNWRTSFPLLVTCEIGVIPAYYGFVSVNGDRHYGFMESLKYGDDNGNWICPYISRHLLSLNPLQARCRRYSRGER